MCNTGPLNRSTDTVFWIGVRAVLWNETFNVTASASNITQTQGNAIPTTKPAGSLQAYDYVSVTYLMLAYPTACYFYNEATDQFGKLIGNSILLIYVICLTFSCDSN